MPDVSYSEVSFSLNALNNLLVATQEFVDDSLCVHFLPFGVFLHKLGNVVIKIDREIEADIRAIEFPTRSARKIIFFFHGRYRLEQCLISFLVALRVELSIIWSRSSGNRNQYLALSILQK